MEKTYFVYIMTNKRSGTLYTGLTDNIGRRAWEHRTGAVPGFTKKYCLKRLVHVEVFSNRYDAAKRERRLKRWRRRWKIELIEKENPDWEDKYPLIQP